MALSFNLSEGDIVKMREKGLLVQCLNELSELNERTTISNSVVSVIDSNRRWAQSK